jgi:serine/threonine-protein kinase
LYVSSGLPTVELIDMRHYSRDDAERYLRDAKLTPKFFEIFDASPRGSVLDQRPPAGSSVPIHAVVALTVSKGLKPVDVPDITSEAVADATTELKQRNLTLAVVERDQSDAIPAGTVLSQNPAAGAAVDPGSTVNVTVSAGAPQLLVPDVSGRTAADATNALQSLGLQTNIEYVVDPSADSGTVLKQTPAPGTQTKKGSTVSLSVVVAGMVPDVTGKSPTDAQTILENAGYKVGNLAYVQEGTEGTVARTEPAATTPLRPGETVMLFVSGVSPSGQ